MGKRLQRYRAWLTPRRQFWMGVGLLATVFAVPMISPGTNVSFLVGPASVFIVGALMSAPNAKRLSGDQ
jgi:hypothetical protein